MNVPSSQSTPSLGANEAVDQIYGSNPNETVILVYTTFPSLSDAKQAGAALVAAGLAACVNIFPQMIAIFAWQGAIEEANEAAMIVKTVEARAEEVLAEIKRLHPYTVPARLILPVTGGGEDFLGWIAQQCGVAMKDG